jgi:hypothetical protein
VSEPDKRLRHDKADEDLKRDREDGEKERIKKRLAEERIREQVYIVVQADEDGPPQPSQLDGVQAEIDPSRETATRSASPGKRKSEQ